MKIFFRLLLLTLIFSTAQSLQARVDVIHTSQQDPSCFEATDGYVTIDSLTTTAPSGNYIIRINTSPVTFFNVGDTIFLGDGNYTITTIDQMDGNSINFKFISINDPFDIGSIPSSTSANCFNVCDGTASIIAFGGTGAFTYVWSDGLSQTTSTAINLCDGKYYVTISDANGCTSLDSATVTEPSEILPTVTANDVACFGDATGSAMSAPTGGSGTYSSWTWSSSGNNTDTENGLVAGNYSVTVTDNTGCTGVENFSISEPAAPLAVSLSSSPVLCFGESTGSITNSVSGGTSPYTYVWNDGNTNQNRNNIPSGPYTVTVTDNNGCSETESITVATRPEILTTLTPSDVSCNGLADGSITITSLTGGTAPYNPINWSNGGSGTSINGLTAGRYYVTVTDLFTCTKVDSADVGEPLVLVPSFDTEVDPTCNGGANGSISASAIGGTPAYTFNWSNGVNGASSISGLNAGPYTVTVIDANGCSNTLTTNLSNPVAIVPTLTPSDALCFGTCTGSIMANPVNGIAPYTYAWSSGGSSQTESNLCAGNYSVTVTDANNCTATESAVVGEPAAAIAISLNQTAVLCFGESTGGITASTSGGTNPYTYLWNDGNPSQNRSNIPAGIYTVTVTDINGCTEDESVTVQTRPELISAATPTNATCNGLNDGSITLTTLSGGTPPYNPINWSNGGSGTSISNLLAGRYYVTITDLFGCTKVDSADVDEPAALLLTLDNQTDPRCTNDANGSIDLSTSGGTPTYTFAWNDGITTEDRSGLVDGTYTITVTDANSCSISQSFTLTDPLVLSATIDSLEDASCSGFSDGFARVLAAGGTGAYTYSWSNGITNAANPNLPIGTYGVTVTDNNGCMATSSATIGAPVVLVASINGTDASCDGIDDGTATASGSGGSLPYTFLWGPGNPTGQNTATISGLAGGTYTVTITDANGCTDDESILISQPSAIALTISGTNILCNGDNTGDATVNPSGGTPAYTYLWSDGSAQTTQTAVNLVADTYTVTVSDANGCTNSISISLSEPSPLGATITASTNPTCNGINDGTATVTAAGGVAPLTYLWSDPSSQTTITATGLSAGTFTVTVTDVNGCTTADQVTLSSPASVIITTDSISMVNCFGGNDGYIEVTGSGGIAPFTYDWSNGPTTRINTPLIAGNYDLTVTDNAGCFSTQSFTITEPPVGLSATTNSTDLDCNGDADGTAGVAVSGGTPAYTYSWGGGQTTATITGLSGGTYNVTVTDNNGCTLTESIIVNEPTQLVISVDATTDVTCNGSNDGTANVSATGGTPNYTFNWSNAGTGLSQSNLSPGPYTVTVTDANGCTDSANFNINEPQVIDFTVVQETNVSCFGANDGLIEVVGTGGTPAYTYNWSNGPTTALNNNLSPGPYTVTISDANGCSTTYSTTITEPTQLNADIIVDKQPCFGASDGELTAQESGGTAPYTYAWLSGQTTQTITGLATGLYLVTITDANGCTATDNTTLTPNPPITLLGVNGTDVSCFGGNDGNGVVLAFGGTAPLTYDWSDGGSGFLRTDLVAQTYMITVSDANGCSVSPPSTLVINEPNQLDPVITSVNETCPGSNDGSISTTPTGGTAPYSFVWSNGNNNAGLTSSITGLSAGTYGLTITDDNACDSIISIDILPGGASFTYTDSVDMVSCFGICDGYIEILNFSGGTAPYTYAWSNGVATAANPNLCAGNYSVTVNDANGCDSTWSYMITEPTQIQANLVTVDESCGGANDGSATASPTGGAGTYTFAWSTGASGNPLTGLTAGNYDVTITDADGCNIIEPFTIGAGGNIAVNPTTNDPSCFGICDGDITLSPSGGTAPYTFLWDDNSTNFFRTALCDGSYDVTVTDATGCSTTQNIILTQPTQIQANLVIVNESCGAGGDGSATASPTGGAGTYTFAWSTGASGNPLTGLTAGNYDVTITDADGCNIVEPFTIGAGGNIAVNPTTNDPSCFGICDGDITLSPSGGTAPYTFLWDDNSTNFFRTALCDGSYDVTVTDATGCSTTQNIILTQPTQIQANLVIVNESCGAGGDGSATASPTGGAGTYTFAWSTGASGNPLTGLTAGNYDVTITDADGCNIVEPFTIGAGGNIAVNPTTNDPSCFGICDGDITLSPSGGTAPYTFLWDDNSTNFFRTALCDGSYDVTVTDATGCSTTQNIILTQPTQIQANLVIVNESCGAGGDGSATASPTGGAGTYTFAWSTGASGNPLTGLTAGNYDVTITDADGCNIVEPFTIGAGGNIAVNPTTNDPSCFGICDGDITLSPSGGTAPYTFLWDDNSTNFFRTALCDGSYDVTVTDATGCSTTQNIILTQPTQIQANLVIVNESCGAGGDGSATASPTGGAGTYTFAWSTGASGNPLTGLTAGNYDVTITDADGCNIVEPFTIGAGGNIAVNPTTNDPSCFGICDGDITLSPSGGTAPYTFLWDDNSTNFFRTALCDGSYDVTVTDATGCSTTQNIILTQPTQIQANLVIVNESCGAGGDGSATASPTGGAGTYTFAWSTGASGNPLTGLTAGNYDVTITDADGCNIIEPFTIGTGGNSNYTYIDSVINPSCFGVCDGSIAIIGLSGGTAPHTYSWSTGSTAQFISGLCAGNYGLTISDATGCDSIVSYTLVEPLQIQANLTITNESCNGGGDGTATAAPSDGIAPYTFAWSTGASGNPLTGLSAGNYDVTITDARGCSIIEPFVISTGSAAYTYSDRVVNASCNGTCDGSIEVLNLSGGTTPYTYNWAGGLTGPLIQSLCAGTYTVTMSDANSCDTIATYTIAEPAPFNTTITTISDTCLQGVGEATVVSVSGGSTPYTYDWSGGVGTGNQRTGLVGGNYFVTITDNSGCSQIEPLTVPNVSTFGINVSFTDVTCNGANDGTITVSTSGGTNPVTYNWSGGLVGANPTNVPPNTYGLTVTDATGCAELASVTISEPDPISATFTITDESCTPGNDGAAIANVSGGTSPFTYAWSAGTSSGNSTTGLVAGTYTVTITDANNCVGTENFTIGFNAAFSLAITTTDASCNGGIDGSISIVPSGAIPVVTYQWAGPQTGPNPTGLASGTYTVTVTDGSGCSEIRSIDVMEGSPIISGLSSTDESCTPGTDGTATSIPSGGTFPYTFMWSGGVSSGNSVSGLTAGSYFLTITDAAGCTEVEPFVINSGSTISVNETVVSPTCFGDCDASITLSPSGGVAPYTYLWGDNSTNFFRTGLCFGTYLVTVTDATSCSKVEGINVTSPSRIAASFIITDESCVPGGDGSATAIPSGGTAPLTYVWSSGVGTGNVVNGLSAGTYTVTITDANACSNSQNFIIGTSASPTVNGTVVDATCNGGSDGSITLSVTGGTNPLTYNWTGSLAGANPSNVNPGTYTVTITDGAGCTASDMYTVGQGSLILANLSLVDESCSPGGDGTATAAPSAGTSPYTFAWSTGSSLNPLTGLSSGNYDVTITDAQSCTVVEPFTISAGSNFVYNEIVNDASCFGICDGDIALSPSGGTAPYTFLWDDNSTLNTRANLCAGSYDVTLSDATGCSNINSFTINEPDELFANLSLVDESCAGNDGSATASPAGGSSPYTFAWSTGASANPLTGLSTGNYDLTLTDANGCSKVEPFTINTSAPIIANELITNPSCFGACDGDITLAPSGGQSPYTYLWGDNSTNNGRTGLCDGTFGVTITDAAGCSISPSFTVTEPQQIVANVTPTDESCSPGGDGSALASPTGGNGPYTFAWSNGTSVNPITGLVPGNYDVTVTDAQGCTDVETFIINPYPPIIPNELSGNETCAGLCDGFVEVNPSGGIGAYTYSWNTGFSTRRIDNLCAGTYTVTITDAAGCDTTVTETINAAVALTGNLSLRDQSCTNLAVCDGRAIARPQGGTAPYSYLWAPGTIPGQSTDTANSLCVGNYSLTITDALGCTFDTSFSISGPPPIAASFNVTGSTCTICNGAITVTASGGSSSNYTYNWLDNNLVPLGVTTDNIGSLCAGIYFVDISDNTGCTGRFSVPLSDIGGEVVNVTGADATCFNTCDGMASANFVCLDPNCSVEWFNAVTGQSTGITTATTNALCKGDYYVQVTNNTGCITIEPISIGGPDAINITEQINDATCFGSADGSISLITSGGTGTLSYNWAPGPITGQGTATISNLNAGVYFVTVSDANSCDTVLSYTVAEPSEIQASFTSIDANCGVNDGFINATVSGGTVAFDYGYQWFDGNNVALTGQVNPSISNIGAGTYFLRVRDDNLCEKTFSISIGSTNAASIVVDSVTNNSCFGANDGEIFITTSGANTPFTFNWQPFGQSTEDLINLAAGTYTLGVTNSLGCETYETVIVTEPSQMLASIGTVDASCGLCNGEAGITISGGLAPYTYLWSNGSTTDSAKALCGGSYTLEVSDANGCSENFIFSVNTSGGPSGETIAVTATSCATSCDGTATVNPIGGSLPYTYLWLHDGSTTNSVSNLCRGDYILQVSDASGCARSVTVSINSPISISINETMVSQTCNSNPCDGSIRLDVSGGVRPYSYTWGPAPQNDTNFLGSLCAGIYNVTVSDANGCSETKSLLLNNNGQVITPNPSVADASCHGSCDGSLISNVTPTVGITFQWFNDAGLSVAPLNNDLVNAACAGDYILEITSVAGGCRTYASVTVDEPDSIILGSSIVRNISCNGACDGEIFISTLGGNLLYSYSWDDPSGQDGIPATNLCAGTYSVTATDANGCSATTSVTLTDPPALNISIISNTDLSCSSDCDASAQVSASGGNAPYTFDWSGGQTGTNPTTLCFGPNIISVTDATGCVNTDTVFIGATDTVVAVIPSQTIFCDGDSIHLLGVAMGSSITSIAWYENLPNNLFTPTLDTTIARNIGSYTFYLIASNGSCHDTSTYNFEVVANPNIGLASSVQIFKDEIAVIQLSGKRTDYLYNWSPGTDLNDSTIAEPQAAPREDRVYTLIVTDSNGCTVSDSINVLYQPSIIIPSGFSPNGDGVNDVWEIDILEEFPNASVTIFNRWGQQLYEQKDGYVSPWDGTKGGEALPIGTYYFIIDFKSDRIEPITGPITLLR